MMRAAARLPLRACLISYNWREERYASLVVARGRAGGRIAVSSFMADLGCLGIKYALAAPEMTETDLKRILAELGAQHDLIECNPAFALKLLDGAFEYAKELGFQPDPDYFAAKQIFGSDLDHDSVADQEIDYGLNGKPFFVAGPYDDAETIVNRLTRKLGPDGFNFIVPAFDDDIEMDLDDPDYDEDLV